MILGLGGPESDRTSAQGQRRTREYSGVFTASVLTRLKTFVSLPPDLQSAVLQYGREIVSLRTSVTVLGNSDFHPLLTDIAERLEKMDDAEESLRAKGVDEKLLRNVQRVAELEVDRLNALITRRSGLDLII